MDRKEERVRSKEVGKKRKIISYVLISFFFLFTLHSSLLTTPSPVFAQVCPPPTGTSLPLGCNCNGPNNTFQCKASGIIQLQQVLTRIINISVTIAFMALTVWLVWSALKFFITSGGDPKALSHAWSSVTWAFMGLFFMVLAFLVLKLIFAVTGANVTQYCLGFPPYCI